MEHAALESNKSKFFDFANSINLRGALEKLQFFIIQKNWNKRHTYWVLSTYQNGIYHFNKGNYQVKSIVKTQMVQMHF